MGKMTLAKCAVLCALCLLSWAAADNEPTPDWVQEKLAKAEKAESNRAKIPQLYHADIFVYDSTTENCSGEPGSIGGCIPTDQGKWIREVYMCDAEGNVFISRCKDKECTKCLAEGRLLWIPPACQ